jgi:hypothetical protein
MVSLDLFERVVNHAAALQDGADRSVSTAHLKADKRRRPVSVQRTRCDALWGGASSGRSLTCYAHSMAMRVDDTAGSEMLDEEEECVVVWGLCSVSSCCGH